MVKKNLETPLCSPSRSDVPSCLASDKQSKAKSLTVKGAKVPPATYVRRVEKERRIRIQVDLRERLEQ